MSVCSFQSQLQAYHDGELPAEQAEKLAAHVSDCLACSAELAELSSMRVMFAAAEPARLSPIGLHRLHRTIDAANQQGLLRLARVVNGAAAAVLVVSSALLLHGNNAASNIAPRVTWTDPTVLVSSDTTALQDNSPAAAWYLADTARPDSSQ